MTRTPLTPHIGHRAVVVNDTQVRCLDCTWLLDWGRSASKQPTPTPPKFQGGGKGVPATSVQAWNDLKERFGRRPTGEAS